MAKQIRRQAPAENSIIIAVDTDGQLTGTSFHFRLEDGRWVDPKVMRESCIAALDVAIMQMQSYLKDGRKPK